MTPRCSGSMQYVVCVFPHPRIITGSPKDSFLFARLYDIQFSSDNTNPFDVAATTTLHQIGGNNQYVSRLLLFSGLWLALKKPYNIHQCVAESNSYSQIARRHYLGIPYYAITHYEPKFTPQIHLNSRNRLC